MKVMDEILAKYSAREISWNAWDPALVDQAKTDGKPLLLFWADDKKDSAETAKALEDRVVAKLHDRLVFVKMEYLSGSDEAKLWGASSAGSVTLVDPNKEAGSKAVLGKLSGRQKAMALRAMIKKGLKKLESEKK